MYYENGEPTAAIYNRDAEILMEIFGVDFKDGLYRDDIFRTLTVKALNEDKRRGKKYMIFFGEEECQRTLLDIGFHCVGEYVLFEKKV